MKWLFRIFVFLLLIFIAASVFTYLNVRDRHPDYTLNLNITAPPPTTIKAGFAAVPINPTITDTWIDVNGDARYVPDDGDSYQDVNGNGQFDPIWIAGFHNRRPALGIHDTLWARAVVIDDGKTKMGLVAIDCIGLGNDDVISIRKELAKTTELDYVSVVSSHTHEAPDVIGVWGASEWRSGINKDYINLLVKNTASALRLAASSTREARIKIAQDLTSATSLVTDSRPPMVMDPGLRLMQFLDVGTNRTLGTLVAWANHPETTWSKNLLISSDFPHYVREAVENGIYHGDQKVKDGLGGIAIYINGAIGGLMTTDPDFGIKDPFSNEVYKKASFQKAKAQGIRLAQIGLNALEQNGELIERSSIRLMAKSFNIPLDNQLYRLASAMGVFKRGMSGWMKIRTEVSMWSLGPATFLMQPGEIYPEIINGGVEAPEGQDFALAPSEAEPLRPMMPGKYTFVVGLSNDLIGYIIPKSQWDEKAPFTYGAEKDHYGEVNSLGPETAPIIYEELKNLIQDF